MRDRLDQAGLCLHVCCVTAVGEVVWDGSGRSWTRLRGGKGTGWRSLRAEMEPGGAV